ncbi:MAG TPA: response regulator [Crinalium sp.]|jgi:PAS domain S-box-containing protein
MSITPSHAAELSAFEPERLQILPTFSYYIRKLLRQKSAQLQFSVSTEQPVGVPPDLDAVLTQIYPERSLANAVVLRIEHLVLAHQKRWATGDRQSQPLKTLETELFWWLGYGGQPQSSAKRILVVDDMPENIRLLFTMLKPLGYDLQSALSGELALKSVQEAPPDLILLDILMPDMDGYEVYRQLKTSPSTQAIPVIFLSALDTLSAQANIAEFGATDYIAKPFKMNVVLERVKHYLQQERSNEPSHPEVTPQEERQSRQAAAGQLVCIFNNAQDGVFQATLDGRYLRVNQALAELYGYESPTTLLNGVTNMWQQVYVDPRHHHEWQNRLSQTTDAISMQSQIRQQDGTVIGVVERVRAVKDELNQVLMYEGTVQPENK